MFEDMKKSDVPGEAFRHLREIPPSESAVPSDQKSPPETISVTRSDLKCPPETIIPVTTSDRKCPPETITALSYLKTSPPETKTITKEDNKDNQELEEDFVEYNNTGPI